MDDRDWCILNALHKEKNITKAAKTLFISQPALTKRLQVMEAEFGVKIVIRQSKGIQFTAEGEYLAKCAEEMLNKLETIKENIINMNGNICGVLKLGVSKFFAKSKLPVLLRSFKEKYPNVDFNIITGWSSDIFKLVYNNSVHIAFVRGDFSWNGRSYLLSKENICIASKNKIDINILPKLPRVSYTSDPILKNMIDAWWTANYSEPPTVSIEVDQSDTCRAMVENGLGYGILPSALIENSKELNIITLKDRNNSPLMRHTWMLYQESCLEMNITKAFVNFIEGLDMKAK
ncbi:LysR family transcriptional regulator [Clostridium sp. 19966]|uniref:LysR family transcriptional regulator n=1 Tax=Clostridium sp. 19966 TaxID=2768166 RepID=UPI0028DFDDD2|nr:LysR family transcriptional regulator [Clostridium sp. 19966]MDT8717991.1 LysR family transcriptional regulator [Clostridium sp. 19966]